MELDWIISPSEESIKDVPWVKEWKASNPHNEEAFSVENFYLCNTGLLVNTNDWKAFLYKGSNDYANVLEALEEYLQYDGLLPRLYAKPNASGKIALGLNHEEIDAVWQKNGKQISQVWIRSEEVLRKRSQKPANPLLPSPHRNSKAKAK